MYNIFCLTSNFLDQHQYLYLNSLIALIALLITIAQAGAIASASIGLGLSYALMKLSSTDKRKEVMQDIAKKASNIGDTIASHIVSAGKFIKRVDQSIDEVVVNFVKNLEK